MGQGMIHPNNKFKDYVFDESGIEEVRDWNTAVPVDKYTYLQSFAGGMASKSKGKRPMNEALTVREVDEAVNERINRSDAALQSSSSNYKSKALFQSKIADYLSSHKSANDRKDSNCNQPLHLADNEIVSIISDEEIDNSSTTFSNDLPDAEGFSGEHVIEHEVTSQDKEASVVVCPESVTYRRSCYSNAKLTFLCSSIKLDVTEEGATGCLTFEWKTQYIISIESRWLDPFKTAEVRLLIKSVHNQKPGISEVKFTLADPDWSTKQDLIKSLDELYKEKWDVDLDSYELFEDTTYLEGDCDSIAISKRDFELLEPEKFINDTIVDFYIEYLKKIKPADARVHFFNSFFFRKLADFDENQLRSVDSKEAFQRVRKWTKKVNIFQTDYIFIPVNFRLHWSLLIICHPGEVVNFTDDELERSPKVPCILHMDSIKGSHRGLEHCIKSYLWEEWKERNDDAPEDISRKFKDLRFLRLEVPQQENSYDCGLFMLHYMELFVKQASNNFDLLNNFTCTDWFYPVEASIKRARIKKLIFLLTKSSDQQFLSPKSSFELKDEDEEEEESDVQILHDTCNSKETSESIPDTCVNKSRDVAALVVKPLRSEGMDTNVMNSDIDGGSMVTDNEQKNYGQMVLYDPSIVAMSPVKENDETVDFVDQQEVMVPETNNRNPIVTSINNSMNSLQLKDELLAGEDDVFESHVVEDSDDDVFETCVVADSDSDSDSGEFFIRDINNKYQKAASVFKDVAEVGLDGETSKRRQTRSMVSGARKRPRRTS